MQLDVVIVGAGLVGASLALALSQATRRRHKMMLVDAFPLNPRKPYNPGFDSRTTALSLSSKVIYEKLGIWQELSNQSAAIETIHVSEAGRWGSTRLVASEQCLEEFGYVVANEVIGQVLLKTLIKQRKVILEAPAQVLQVKPAESGYSIRIKPADDPEGEEVFTKLLVIADGGRSNLLQQLGIETQVHDYQQQALVTNLEVSKAHQQIAYERFTKTGALALLPLPDFAGKPRYSLVWTAANEEVDGLLTLPEHDFLQQLQQQMGFRCGKFVKAGALAHYPLSLAQATEQVRPGLVVLGNAAHTLHPVAGQGYNLALRDTMTLSALINRVTTSDELSSAELVQHYLSRQLSDQQRVIRASDGLVKLFGSSSFILRRGRQLGLIGLNLLLPAKHQFAQLAMGTSGVATDWRD